MRRIVVDVEDDERNEGFAKGRSAVDEAEEHVDGVKHAEPDGWPRRLVITLISTALKLH